MKLIVREADGAVVIAGPDDLAVAPQPGHREEIVTVAREDFDAAVAAAGPGGEVALVDGALVARPRTPTPEEVAAQEDLALADRLQAQIDAWGTLTAAQKDALVKLSCQIGVRGLRRLARVG